MNGATSPQPSRRRYTPTVAGRVKSSSRLRLKQPDVAKTRWLTQPDINKALWICLLVTLGVDGLGAVALGYRDFVITTTLPATLGAIILVGIGFANLLALYGALRSEPWWARATVIAQFFVVLLAAYVSVLYVRSPSPDKNWYVMALAFMVGLLALVWIHLLGARASVKWTKTTVIIAALFPLAGLLQFWLQTYYTPQTSKPQVDVFTDLTPQGRTGPIIHLSAKVTVHNRSSVVVNVAGALMRVTAYSKQPPPPGPSCEADAADQQWCQIAGGLDLTGANADADFRADPTPAPAENAQLLYTRVFMSGPPAPCSRSSLAACPARVPFLTPGQIYIFQRTVDLDSRTYRLARLSVSAVFVTERRIKDAKWCTRDYEGLANRPVDTLGQPIAGAGGWHNLCIQYDLEPTSVIDELIASHFHELIASHGHPVVLRVRMIIDAPKGRGNEYRNEHPRVHWFYTTPNQKNGSPDEAVETKIVDANPTAEVGASAEYAAADQTPPSQTPPSSGSCLVNP